MRRIKRWEKKLGFTFGLIFISIILIISLFIPDPTPFQHEVFKTIMALAASGIAGILIGFLRIEGTFKNIVLRAGGALAIFLVVYLLYPSTPETQIKTEQIMNGNYGTQINENKGIIEISNKKIDSVNVK